MLNLIAFFCVTTVGAIAGVPSCGNTPISILTTTYAFPLEGLTYVCPLDDAVNNSGQTWIFRPQPDNFQCNYSIPAEIAACALDRNSSSLAITNIRDVCNSPSPLTFSCSNGSSTIFITIDCRPAGFYRSSLPDSDFSATVGTMFSTIAPWIAYGIDSASLQLNELIGESYVKSDVFTVDYAPLSRCLKPTSVQQLNLRLQGTTQMIVGSVAGLHTFVVTGNSSSGVYRSSVIYLNVQNATLVPPSTPKGLTTGNIIGIAIAGTIVFIIIIGIIVVLVTLSFKRISRKLREVVNQVKIITDVTQKNELDKTEVISLPSFPTKE